MNNHPIFVLAALCLTLSLSQVATAQDRRITKPASVTPTTDRELDGLQGPVRRVRVETSKITVKEGQFVEGPRVLRETATYDPKGRKIDSVAHPVEGTTLPGKEEYRYDESGNIVEMTLRGDDGSTLSKETYQYELDEIGNWKKMISSVAIYENGKLIYEPIEVTYRTIAYYYGQAVDQLVSGDKKPAALKRTSGAGNAIPPAVANKPLENKAAENKAPIATKVSTTGTNLAKSTENAVENSELSGPEEKAAAALPETPLKAVDEVTHQPKPVETKLSSGSANMAGGTPVVTDPPPAWSNNPPPNRASGSGSLEVATAPETKTNPAPIRTNNNVENNSAAAAASNTQPVALSTPVRSAPATVAAHSATTPVLSPAAAQYEQGLTHLAAARYPEAVKAFSESVKLNPNEVQPYIKLGIAHSSQGQNKEAVAALKMALQINREQVDALGYYHLGRAYGALGKHSNALDSFKQTLNIMKAETIDPTKAKDRSAPPLAHVHHGMGAMYYNMQRPKEAIKELKRAVELNSNLADAYYVLALSYIDLGNRTSAEAQRNILQKLDGALARKIDAALSNFNPGHCKTVFGPC